MQIPLIWLYFAGGLAAGLVVTWMGVYLVMSRRQDEALAKWRAAEQEREAVEAAYKKEIESLRHHEEALAERLSHVSEEAAALRVRVERIPRLEEVIEHKEEAIEALRARNVDLEKELSDLTARMEEERRQTEKNLKELKEARESMQKEFKLLAANIMEENSRRFTELSKQRVEEVLKPLGQQVVEFKKRIEDVHNEETKEMATLLNEIKHLKELNLKISEDAVNLTKALRGESKRQGVWGEMVLEKVLEASGLREGEEYEREVSLQDDEKRRYRPDVIVHLPNDRDIVIDAKTSLVAYEKYIKAENEEERKRYARQHLEAVKNHVDRLAEKGYANLEGVNTLDFIFMFMPIEGALMLALETDPQLYDKAFRKHIVLVSPTTLLVALRAVENTWRHERQNRNAMEIARRAGALYDKFVGFAEDLEKVGKQLETVRKTYDSAWNKLRDGRGNIVWQIEELKALGARASKEMPKNLADAAHAPSIANVSE